jgi:hypothetical protein
VRAACDRHDLGADALEERDSVSLVDAGRALAAEVPKALAERADRAV